ncbi:hypothetical protein DITRI_Ditri15bG0014900 [Diplodiscus trichospermus]
MAEAVIGAAVEVTLSNAISIVEKLVNLHWDFKDELNKLRDSLAMTRAFLHDAGRRKVDDEPVQVWLKQLRKIACEADDVLDELAYEDLRRKVETQTRKKVHNFLSIYKNPILFSSKMHQTVKSINISLNEIIDRASKFGLQQRVHTLPSISRGSPVTHSFGDSSQVVGREADISNIIDFLISSNTRQTFSITSIVGMGGLGKTTLAKSVCKNERTKNYFNKIIWVCVSDKFDVQRILQEMFESLTGETDRKNRDTIIENIKKELEEKIYLLILDDVWDEDIRAWEDLRSILLGININIRSSILVTTRSANVAIVRDTAPENRYFLKSLEENECWDIIRIRAFQNSSISSALEGIGRDIARKCGGVPLVANVIGGTMSNKRDIDEWVSLRDSSHWGSLEKNDWILRVLRLSFDRLASPSLKQCFVYCSIFPKDLLIQKEKLIQLWMAEGFFQQTKEKTLEDIGNEYFNDLLSNSLLQDVEKDLHGCVTGCKMHDLVYDLAQSIRNSESGDTSHSQLHVFAGVKWWHCLFSKFNMVDFKGLRVLDFSYVGITSLSKSIGSLRHLRYLHIPCTCVRRLPKSITQLYHLQTLNLLGCWSLRKLPKGMENLVNLRHLYINHAKHVPQKIGCLTNLRTLSIFGVGRKRRCGIRELGCLSELGGKLVIDNLQNVRNKEEALGAKMWEKKLHTLTCKWHHEKEGCNNDEEVLEGLKPHSNLKRLTIEGYHGECLMPSWLVSNSVIASFQLINLVELYLFDCKKLHNVPTLGKYPNLRFLEIRGLKNVRCIGNEFYIDNNNSGDITLFPALEKFTLWEMGELKEWLDVEPTIPMFPSLKELSIKNCPNLGRVPVMSTFSSLEMLSIRDCRELSSIGNGLFPSTLKKLETQDCWNLSTIPDVEGGISFLQELQVILCFSSLLTLKLIFCNGLTSLPSELRTCTSLQELYVFQCTNLESIPEDVAQLHSLRHLCISHCQNLKRFPEDTFGHLTSLEKLTLGAFSEELEEFPGLSSIHHLHSSLEDLTLFGWEKLSSLPDQLQCLTTLEKLCILNFSGVKALPEWLGNLSSLEFLMLSNCEILRHLPSKEAVQRHSNLRLLIIGKCPQLKENSAEQSKISHIISRYSVYDFDSFVRKAQNAGSVFKHSREMGQCNWSKWRVKQLPTLLNPRLALLDLTREQKIWLWNKIHPTSIISGFRVVEAVLAVKMTNALVEIKYQSRGINILKLHGESARDSYLSNGYALNTWGTVQGRRRSELPNDAIGGFTNRHNRAFIFSSDFKNVSKDGECD